MKSGSSITSMMNKDCAAGAWALRFAPCVLPTLTDPPPTSVISGPRNWWCADEHLTTGSVKGKKALFVAFAGFSKHLYHGPQGASYLPVFSGCRVGRRCPRQHRSHMSRLRATTAPTLCGCWHLGRARCGPSGPQASRLSDSPWRAESHALAS